jgi:beta-lactamase class A
MQKNYIRKFCVIAGIFLLGFFIGWLTFKQSGAPSIFKITQGTKGLINPLLGFEIQNAKEFSEFKPLADALRTEVKRIKGLKNGVDQISIYFRELNNGRWVGVNEDIQYYPASLMKVPLLFAYLKVAEEYPETIADSFVYTKSLDQLVIDPQQFQPNETLQVGRVYTVKQALEKMVIYSDNRSATVLSNRLNKDEFYEILTDLNLPAGHDGELYTISAKDYSYFFRVLYNSTYLNREMSEYALELLSKATFKEGMTASIPDSITVAHKFGNYTNDATRQEEIHDCGIVYFKPDPYFLCVMTRGADGYKEMDTIKSISKIVYEDVVKRTR